MTNPPYQPKPSLPLVPATARNQLVCSVPFVTRDGTPRNLVTGGAAVVTGSLGWSNGVYGPARDVSPLGGSNTEKFTTFVNVDWQHGPFTVEVWITFRSFPTLAPQISGVFWNQGDGGSTSMLRLNDGLTANNAPIFMANSSSLVGVARLAANVPYQLAMTYDGATLAGYVNGALDGTKAVAVGGGVGGKNVVLYRDDSTGRGPDAQCHALNVWTRVLPPAELAARFADPWAIWRPRRSSAPLLAALTAGGGVAVRAAMTNRRRRS